MIGEVKLTGAVKALGLGHFIGLRCGRLWFTDRAGRGYLIVLRAVNLSARIRRTRLNILQVIPQMHAGGAERTVLEVAEAIMADGGQALVASRGGRLVAELEALGARHVTLEMDTKNPLKIWTNANKLAQLIRAEKIDIVHARSRAPAWSAKWAARRTQIPFVTTYHGFYKAKSRLKRWYNSIMAQGDRAIANSEFTARHVREEHEIDPNRLRVIPRGVDLDQFDPALVNPERIKAHRAAWGAGPEKLAIVLPGRLTRWKGQLLMIEALAQLKLDPGPLLVCLGEGGDKPDYQAELKAAADAAGVDLALPGHTTDIAAAYLAADLVVCPSLEPEAFGRTAAEAQAMGARVIVADHGGAREVVRDGETGWRAAPGDADAWAKAVKAALSLNAEGANTLALAARKRVRTHFSKVQLQQATLRVYRELLD